MVPHLCKLTSFYHFLTVIKFTSGGSAELRYGLKKILPGLAAIEKCAWRFISGTMHSLNTN